MTERSFCPGLVSVVMPAYNCEGLLPESVASVVGQTYQNWELIIIDDASRDGTLTIAERLAAKDPRVRAIHLSENGGVANARNVGIEAARGRFLAFLDSDDLWLPEKLETQLDFMTINRVGFSFTQYRFLLPDGRLGSVIGVAKRVGYKKLLKGNTIGCLTVMIDRATIPPFRMPTIGHEDYATWLAILRGGYQAWGIEKDLARYRVAQASSVSGNKKRSAMWTWSIYRKIENLSIPTAAWYFVHYSARAVSKHLLGS